MNKKISLGCDRAAHEGAYVRVWGAGWGTSRGNRSCRPTGTHERAVPHPPAGAGAGVGEGGWDCARERGGTALKRQCKQRLGLASLLSSGRFSSAQGVSFIYPAAALPPEALPCFCSH